MQSFDFLLIGIISFIVFGIMTVMSCPTVVGCTSFPEPYNILKDIGIYGVALSIVLIIISFIIPRGNNTEIDDTSKNPISGK